MKGYRTILVGAAMVVLPSLLTYLAGIKWSDYVSPETALMISGAITIAMRVVTTTPVGANITSNTVIKILVAAIAISLFLPRPALAGDINAPALTAINKAVSAPSTCLSAGDCSGKFFSFGIGAQSNSGAPNLLANGLNSAFSDGLDVFAGAGYQVWKGQWLAGIELTGGVEFTNGGIKRAGGNFVGTEFVKLGYNFFPSTATTSPAPSQNPFLNLVPANFLANSTPAIILGGVQRHGLSVAAVGMEIDTVISAGWTSYAQIYNSPSQQGLPNDTTFRIGLQKHF